MALHKGREVQIVRDAVKGDPDLGTTNPVVIVNSTDEGQYAAKKSDLTFTKEELKVLLDKEQKEHDARVHQYKKQLETAKERKERLPHEAVTETPAKTEALKKDVSVFSPLPQRKPLV